MSCITKGPSETLLNTTRLRSFQNERRVTRSLFADKKRGLPFRLLYLHFPEHALEIPTADNVLLLNLNKQMSHIFLIQHSFYSFTDSSF